MQVNTPMMISPIMMIPEYKTRRELQEEFLKNVDHMRVRKGPLVADRERLETKIPVEKADYVQKSVLMAPPILFQTMARKTNACPFKYSSIFVEKIYSQALTNKCDASVYDCDEAIMTQNESVFSCIGDNEENASFFGIPPLEFSGNVGYADFLYAIADNAFIHRDSFSSTKEFINSATREAQVVAVFFTPSSGLLTGSYSQRMTLHRVVSA